MTISELMDVLSTAQNKYGDLDVFTVVGTQEYMVERAFRSNDGPLSVNEERSSQHDLPERVVIELADF